MRRRAIANSPSKSLEMSESTSNSPSAISVAQSSLSPPQSVAGRQAGSSSSRRQAAAGWADTASLCTQEQAPPTPATPIYRCCLLLDLSVPRKFYFRYKSIGILRSSSSRSSKYSMQIQKLNELVFAREKQQYY